MLKFRFWLRIQPIHCIERLNPHPKADIRTTSDKEELRRLNSGHAHQDRRACGELLGGS